MPFGEFQYSVDDKGRVVIPPSFRYFVEDGMIVTRGMERCLFVFPLTSWQQIVAQLNKLSITDPKSRKFLRYFYSGASKAKIDGAGRITLPNTLRGFAELDSSVVIAGAPNHLEIWNEARWISAIDEMQENLEAPDPLQEMIVAV